MSDCVFCSIAADSSPAYRLYEDENTLAFLDIDRGELAATSGRPSHFDDENRSVVLSDSVSHRGHTVATRTAEDKFVRHFGKPLYRNHRLSSTVEPFNGDGAGYHVCSDPWEHHSLPAEKVPAELQKITENVQVTPSDIASVEGTLKTATRDRLRDLGYVE